MIKSIIISAAIVLLPAAVQAQQVPRQSDYRAIVPPDWTLLPAAAKSDERRFVSPQHDAWLSLYAAPAQGKSLQATKNDLETIKDGRITYERVEPNWLVVSGYSGDRIFYRRASLACGGRKWHYLEFEYPASQKRAFDQFVTRASYALTAYGRAGCGATRPVSNG